MYESFYGNDAMCGGRNESQMEGYTEDIKSKDIITFSYVGTDFSVFAKKENNKITISCNGGGKYDKRDGSLYGIRYETEDDSIFKQLQEVIDENHETRGNGHCIYVNGLPGGIGDILNVEYASGEKIYKSSNQSQTVSFESSKKFNEIFHQFIVKDGYEYNTEGSNVKLFDDADEEYLQGTWKGTHFGNEVEVTFNKNLVTISVDGKITDENVEYIIFRGFVKKNKLKEDVDEPKKEYDYEEFNGADAFAKKNWFTLTGYFHEYGSSSCDLHNFDKEKPEEEK